MTTGPTTPEPRQGVGRALRVVAPARATPIDPVAELERIRGENETLYAVITTVSSSLDLGHVLDGIVEIATEATDCHACFVYFVEGERLVLRAASPMYRFFVGKLTMGLDEGLTGWVARNRTPEFIRDQALSDPRMKYMPELEEERFQSMVAVPVTAKGGDVIGVIVLHTAAPREFAEEVLNFLVHTASLVGGAIENAQLFQAARRRVEALTALARLSQRLAAVTEPGDLYAAVTEGVRHLLGVDACHVYRLVPERDELHLAASEPEDAPAPTARVRGTGLLFDLLRREGGASGAAEGDRVVRALWPAGEDGAVLVTPLVVSDEQLGILCAYSTEARAFDVEEVELFRSVANQAAVGLKKGELIERLTAENTVKDLFAALGEGVTEVADAKAAAAGFDLSRPHVFLEGGPAQAGGPAWAEVSAALEAAARSALPSAVFDAGSDSLRAIVPMPDGDDEAREPAPGPRRDRGVGRSDRRPRRRGARCRRGPPRPAARRPMRRGSDVSCAPAVARSPTSSSAPTATSCTSTSTTRRRTATGPRSSSSPTTTGAGRATWSRPSSSSSWTAAAWPPARGRSSSTPTRCASAWTGSRSSRG